MGIAIPGRHKVAASGLVTSLTGRDCMEKLWRSCRRTNEGPNARRPRYGATPMLSGISRSGCR